MMRALAAVAILATLVAAFAWLMWPAADNARLDDRRRALFEQATLRAEPLLAAIARYSTSTGQPPDTLAALTPDYLAAIPATGIERCPRFEWRVLPDSQATLVWYDLGSRQGLPATGTDHYRAGDPAHAVLVFVLDGQENIKTAVIERPPKDVEASHFDSAAWKAGRARMVMAPDLAETWRLYGMPRTVFEDLLGPPDGSRALHKAPWELRINCPTRLLNRDALVYWPTEQYPEHLYGGRAEAVGSWVYLHN